MNDALSLLRQPGRFLVQFLWKMFTLNSVTIPYNLQNTEDWETLYKLTMLRVILHGCEIWYHILRGKRAENIWKSGAQKNLKSQGILSVVTKLLPLQACTRMQGVITHKSIVNIINSLKNLKYHIGPYNVSFGNATRNKYNIPLSYYIKETWVVSKHACIRQFRFK